MVTGIGNALRAARRERGHSLADAANATRVRETYLAALEEEEFDGLGGDVYARGFLTSYAKFLDLDPDPLLEAFRRRHDEHARPEPRPAADEGVPVPPGSPTGTRLIAVIAIIVMVVLVWVGIGDGATGAAGVLGP